MRGKPDHVPVDGGGWATSGPNDLDADPSSIRGFADNIAAMAGNVEDDLPNVSGGLMGRDLDDQAAFSQGGFKPGQDAQEVANEKAEEMSAGVQATHIDLTAISMASHMVADILSGGDGLAALGPNTIDYAFADPDANRPAGVPYYVQGTLHDKMSISENEKKEEEPISKKTHDTIDGTVISERFRTADGGIRLKITNPDGTYKEWTRDENGNLIFHEYSRRYYGEEVVITTDETTGNRTTQTTDRSGNGFEQQVDSDGNILYDRYSTDHTSISTQYYTNGRPKTVTRTSNVFGGETTISYDRQGNITENWQTYTFEEESYSTNYQDYHDEHRVTETVDEEGNTDTSITTHRTYEDGTQQWGTTDPEDGIFRPKYQKDGVPHHEFVTDNPGPSVSPHEEEKAENLRE